MVAEGSANIRELRNFIDGEFVASDKTFENTTPVDGTLLSHVHEATEDMVDLAVAAARKAYRETWGGYARRRALQDTLCSSRWYRCAFR